MMPDTESSQASSLSERVYRALLVAYPKELRRAYGLQMTQVFKGGKYLSSAVPGGCSAVIPGAVSIGEERPVPLRSTGPACDLEGKEYVTRSVHRVSRGTGRPHLPR